MWLSHGCSVTLAWEEEVESGVLESGKGKVEASASEMGRESLAKDILEASCRCSDG